MNPYQSRVHFLLTILLLSQAVLAEGTGGLAYIKVNAGVWGAPTARVFAVDTMEKFNSNWLALRVPLETARHFETLPHFFILGLGANYKDDFLIRTEFPLRRDIEAWYLDSYKRTYTFSPSELDLNVPTEAWGQWNNPAGFVKFGRFKPELAPTPNSIILGGAPHHDAVHWKFNAGIARYAFFLSSLNPWLTESEKEEQRTMTIPNARKRFYTEPVKNLLLHKVGIEGKFGYIYIIEQALVGGKPLDFRDVSPFMAWHNNFNYGHTKPSTAFEAGLKPTKNSEFYWQVMLEDVQSPVGEDIGDICCTTLGFLAGYKQKIPLGVYGEIESRIDAVRTDPELNNNRAPLQKMTSRKIYNSNFREQAKPNFADMYIVDYPLGYRRGPDAIDLWWNLKYSPANKKFKAELETAYLRQGDCEIYSEHSECSQRKVLGGVEEKVFLLDFLANYYYNKNLNIYAGAGFQNAKNKDHILGANKNDTWLKAGIGFYFD
ncbi:MAG: hypothetical protein LBC85_10400 [Fibromonadaceae bacterium]|jgi:hypothetical protein|nr:hypothetical protein [Fibromonadaceae bacterium]